jgi:hypothetical protein
MDEVRENAERAFARADTNNSGTISIFEQQDWAQIIGAGDGQLANAVSFDTNIDRQVTLEEFSNGLLRIARPYMDSETEEIPFSNLIMKPNGERNKKPRKPPPQQIVQ